jgi:hypothetical protein
MARSTSLLNIRTTTSVFGAARASFTTIHLTRTVQHSRTLAMPLIGGDRAAPRRFSFASTSASTCGPEKALHQKIAQLRIPAFSDTQSGVFGHLAVRSEVA